MKKRIIIILLAVAAAFGFIMINEAQGRFDCDDSVVTVEPGQTMWAIASSHCTGNVQSAVDSLVRQYGSVIQVGQKIQLP